MLTPFAEDVLAMHLFRTWRQGDPEALSQDSTALRDLGCTMCECRLLLAKLDTCRWLPGWLVNPSDHGRVRAQSTEEGYVEQGNELWECLFFVAGLPSVVRPSVSMATPTAEYGQRTNKSAKGTFKYHGNVVESLFGHLQGY